jgi:hypothetical protein
VLLEIETDKAQMDVEAQDDGILAKIVVPAGSKGVAVGTRIAVLAEEGDDLATLEMPSEQSQAKKEEVKEAITPQQPVKQEQHAATPTPTARPDPNRPQHPSPSVMGLLKLHNLDASQIAGTGPKGRLLKGDILAHLGHINASTPAELSARISKLSKMDLSNVKPAAPKPKPTPAAAAPHKKAAHPPPPPSELALPVNFAEVSRIQQKLRDTLGVSVPLSTFISKATAAANQALPPPAKAQPSQDEIFNDLLGLPNPPRQHARGSFQPAISPLPRRGVQAVEVGRAQLDILDELIGAATPTTRVAKQTTPQEGILAGGENLLTLKVPKEEEERARVFLGRVKGLLEQRPAELVL